MGVCSRCGKEWNARKEGKKPKKKGGLIVAMVNRYKCKCCGKYAVEVENEDREVVELIQHRRDNGVSWDDISIELSGKLNREGQRSAEVVYKNYQKRFGKKLLDYFKENGISPENVDTVWDKSKEYSVCTRYGGNPTTEEMISLYRDTIEKDYGYLKQVKPKLSKGNLLVVDPADVHLGKLASFEGHKYNIDIAMHCAREGVQGIINMSKSFNISQIVFVIGNDVLHIDNPKRTTTAGTPQDTDGMWWDMYNAGTVLYREIVGWLKEIAPVHVIHCPANHANVLEYALAVNTNAHYNDDKDVTFDINMNHRKYFKWGKTLLGFSHGDGAKLNNYPQLMADESKMWDSTKYRYFLLHHLHHHKKVNWNSGEDHIGCTVQYLRSPSQPDRWHHDNGYVGVKRAVEGFVYTQEYGQCASFTHNF
jgi:hypothetical protein